MNTKFNIGDEVITVKTIKNVDNTVKLVNCGIKGKIIDVDVTARTTQPYLVDFENSAIDEKKFGTKWWIRTNKKSS